MLAICSESQRNSAERLVAATIECDRDEGDVGVGVDGVVRCHPRCVGAAGAKSGPATAPYSHAREIRERAALSPIYEGPSAIIRAGVELRWGRREVLLSISVLISACA